MSQKKVSSLEEEEHAYREHRLAAFLADCQRAEGGTEQVEAQHLSATKSPQPLVEKKPTIMMPSPLQHFGHVALSGKPEDVKQLRIEIVLEPCEGAKNKGDTFLVDLDIEVQKPN